MSFCRYILSLIVSSLLGPNIPVNTLFSNALNLCSSLNARDQVSLRNTSTLLWSTFLREYKFVRPRIPQKCPTSSLVAPMMTFHFLPYQQQEQYKGPALIVSDSIGIEKLIVWMCCRCISLAASLYYYRRKSATWLAFSLHTVIIMKGTPGESGVPFLPAARIDFISVHSVLLFLT